MHLLILPLLWASQAHAMCVSTSYDPVAWSKDGHAVLIEEVAHGPEGGGSISYLLVDFHKKKAHVFPISSNFSPGDETKPETISEETCRETTAKGNQLLEELGFQARFKADAKYCHKSRDDILK